jgi:hypothetical protein
MDGVIPLPPSAPSMTLTGMTLHILLLHHGCHE